MVILIYNGHASAFSRAVESFPIAFTDALVADPATQAKVPHIDYVREAGEEGIELVMWLIMRGAPPRTPLWGAWF